MNNSDAEESEDSMLKAIKGGVALCITWSLFAIGGETNQTFGFIVALIGGPAIIITARETSVGRLVLAVTLLIMALITFLAGGEGAATMILLLLGCAGVILAYEAGRRRISSMRS